MLAWLVHVFPCTVHLYSVMAHTHVSSRHFPFLGVRRKTPVTVLPSSLCWAVTLLKVPGGYLGLVSRPSNPCNPQPHNNNIYHRGITSASLTALTSSLSRLPSEDSVSWDIFISCFKSLNHHSLNTLTMPVTVYNTCVTWTALARQNVCQCLRASAVILFISTGYVFLKYVGHYQQSWCSEVLIGFST